MKKITRNLKTSAFLSVAGMVGLWAAPNAFGKVLAQEDYGSYTPGVPIIDQTGGGTGFAGNWVASFSLVWWGQPITAEGPVSFDGKSLATGGKFLGGLGRLQRMMTTPETAGTVYVAYTFNAKNYTDAGENQVWIVSGESKPRTETYNNDNTTSFVVDDAGAVWATKFDAVAGFRVLGKEIMYYDTSLPNAIGASEGDDPLTTDVKEDTNPLTVGGAAEVYHKFTLADGVTPATINSALLLVAKIEVAANKVSYYVFTPGADISSMANATYKVEGLAIHADKQVGGKSPVAGLAMFTVGNDKAEFSNFRIAQNYKEATPTFNAWAYAPMSRGAIAVDNTSWWTNVQPMPVTNFFPDGVKNVAATNAADFSANSYVSWDATNLYVAVAVKDQELIKTGDNKDTVEVYFDGNMSRSANLGWPTNYDQVDDFQLIFKLSATAAQGATIEGAWSANPTGNPPGYKGAFGEVIGTGDNAKTQNFEGITYKVTTTADGYILTAVVNLATVLKITEPYFGQYIGYDIAVVDFDTPAVPTVPATLEKSQYFASDKVNANWNGTQNFGTLALLPAVDPIAWDDFSGYTVDEVLDGNGTAANGWAAAWYKAWQPSWTGTAKATKVVAGPLAFGGDMLVSGNNAGGGGSFARVARQLAAPLATSGSYWVGFVMSKGSHLQVRLDTKGGEPAVPPADPTTNADTSSVAGYTMTGGEIQALDASKSPTYKNAAGQVQAEVYVPMTGWPYPEGNAYYVINVDYDMAKVNYYVFMAGDDVSDPMNATLKQSFDLNVDRAHSFDSVALFTVFSDVKIGNLVIGDDYSQLVKPAAVDPVKGAVAHMTATPPTLDGTMDEVWAAAPSYPIALIHGGKTIPTTDLEGSFRALWDAEYLYLFFSVTDDQLIKFGDTTHPEKADNTGMQNDEFEVFTDARYNRNKGPGWPPVYDSNDIQWAFRAGTDGFFSGFPADWQYGSTSNPDKVKPAGWGTNYSVAGVTSATGYTAEVRISWAGLAYDGDPAAGSMIGLEVQLNDRDLPQEPAVDGKYVYPSDGKKGWADGNNNAWHQTSTHGTLYLAQAAVDAFQITPDPAAIVPVPRAGGSAIMNVAARFQYSNWTAVPNKDQAWNTVANGTGTGDGTFEITLAATDEAYTREATVGVGINTGKIKQQGILPVAAEVKIIGLKKKAGSPGVFTHPWLKDTTISAYPWLGTTDHGWLYFGSKNTDTSNWLWDIKNGWLYTGNGIAPFYFSATKAKWMWFAGKQMINEVDIRWFYVFNEDGTGAWEMLPMSM
ncbi:MAG: sugar-binding protein [Verrucomicrobiota bacterium]|nr:sugar-binding protein [Verrucomicrobiota bacterium]